MVSDRSDVPAAALALQAGGRAGLVVEGTGSDESLISSTELQIGDGFTVRLRLSELVFADGTGGLPADTVVGTTGAAVNDPALEAALAMVRRPIAAHHARAPLEPRAAPPPQRDYAGMTYPSLPYRLLAAFRIWANGLRPHHSSAQRTQPMEKDISDGLLRTPSSSNSRPSSG